MLRCLRRTVQRRAQSGVGYAGVGARLQQQPHRTQVAWLGLGMGLGSGLGLGWRSGLGLYTAELTVACGKVQSGARLCIYTRRGHSGGLRQPAALGLGLEVRVS